MVKETEEDLLLRRCRSPNVRKNHQISSLSNKKPTNLEEESLVDKLM